MKEEILEKKVLFYSFTIILFMTLFVILLVHFNNNSIINPESLNDDKIITYVDDSGIILEYQKSSLNDGDYFKIDNLEIKKALKKKNVIMLYKISLYNDKNNIIKFKNPVTVKIPTDNFNISAISLVEDDKLSNFMGFSNANNLLEFEISDSCSVAIIGEKNEI